MEYSAVIVTYNKKRDLKTAIDSVLKQIITPNEFIIIDNNSTDGTIEFLLKYKKKYPILKIYRSKTNLGLCKGINVGVNLAKNPIILNMDHDSELVNNNWTELALQKLKRKRVALIWGTSNKGNFPKSKYGVFIGSAILFKKKIFTEVGGFPEEFFIYSNETDLTVRLHIAGYFPYFYEKIDVKHTFTAFHGNSSIEKRKLFVNYDLSNRLFIYWKYYPSYIAFVLSALHFLKILKHYAKRFGNYSDAFKGLIRFISKFYPIVYRNRRVLPLNQFFRICYQQQFPFPIYYILKKLYG